MIPPFRGSHPRQESKAIAVSRPRHFPNKYGFGGSGIGLRRRGLRSVGDPGDPCVHGPPGVRGVTGSPGSRRFTVSGVPCLICGVTIIVSSDPASE